MSLATLITSLRTLANDGPDGKVIFSERLGTDPAMPVDGANTNFRLRNIPLVDANQSGTNDATNMWVTIVGTGAVYRSKLHTLFKVMDNVNGIIQFVAAPNPGTAQGYGIFVDYNYYWFSDAKYTEFLNESMNDLMLDTPSDPTKVSAGLVPAMMQYAFARFFRSRASQYMERYSSSGGEAGQSVESVAKGYLAAATASEKRGDSLRDGYYTKQGQKLTPAYGGTSQGKQITSVIDPVTPFR